MCICFMQGCIFEKLNFTRGKYKTYMSLDFFKKNNFFPVETLMPSASFNDFSDPILIPKTSIIFS